LSISTNELGESVIEIRAVRNRDRNSDKKSMNKNLLRKRRPTASSGRL